MNSSFNVDDIRKIRIAERTKNMSHEELIKDNEERLKSLLKELETTMKL